MLSTVKRDYARRCYERLFLQLLRGTSPALPLSQADIQSIADEEYFSSGHERIETKVRGDELAVDKRHGLKLFKDSSATAALLPAMLREPHPFRCSANAAFMVKNLASLFLCGIPALLSPTRSPAKSVMDSCEKALDLPHYLSIVNDQLPAFSSSTSCSPGAGTTLTSLEPRLMTFSDFKSVCPSVVGGSVSNCRSSAKSTSFSQESRKRPLAVDEIIAQVRESKRACHTPSESVEPPIFVSAAPITAWGSNPKSAVGGAPSTATVEYMSSVKSIPCACHKDDCGTPASVDSLVEAYCCWSPTSLSNYEGEPSPSIALSYGAALNKDMEWYKNLDQSPYDHLRASEETSDDVVISTAPSDANSRSPLRTSLTNINAAIQRSSLDQNRTITFQLQGREAMFYVSERTEEAVRGFIMSQVAVDRNSKFFFTSSIDGELYEAHSKEHLIAIWRTLPTVVVVSEDGHFASTQHPTIVDDTSKFSQLRMIATLKKSWTRCQLVTV
ncbi:hypothetical protein HBH74_235750 [Parastagonospora nodorum]|nr:hypothetical protein HBH74_235750 [Parastagonospora nodorum]